ncbi:LacI family transcriptional regulator [Lederbergia galactosidilyticus]|uniref:LacI family DNA-binding transcriptional regulator n=1 Tax=Lederbergia galactosidilytica TaxID=217031 RepID=UPI001AE7BAD1|nr:LacI family DNA-binding transcriptional regulator [Lederbergia galactosidilytica]MBP1915793.1 LacI family transcriptional regulator [Lederbergia galactosidilytica]
MVTIKDVAKEAGVSVATVSRVLNNKGGASTETITHVENIIKKLNYKPNRLAKSLSEGNSNLIAFLVPTLNNPFFPELVKEVEKFANENGFNILLCNSDDDRAKVEYYLDSMIDHYVSGAIINSLHVGPNDLAVLEERGIRTITIDRANFEHPYSAITVDHSLGAQLAVTHLIRDEQCKNLVFISGPKNEKSAIDRLTGFTLALNESENPVKTTICYGDFGIESGYENAKALIQTGKSFDSIFCANDAMAIGAMRACHEFGFQIPNEVKIVGYDNVSLSSYMYPPLSSVDQCKRDIGKLAVSELIHLIKHKNQKPKQYHLEPSLVIRKSSGGN